MRRYLAAPVLAACMAAAGTAQAAGPTEFDTCFQTAGDYYGISPLLLKAIARQESSMNPRASNQNTNGTKDIGLMQINTTHMPKLRRAGVDEQRLWEPCVNIAVGAWVLADAVSRHGMTWKAVGIYHSPTEWRQKDYAARIQRHLVREIRAYEAMAGSAAQAAPATPARSTPVAASAPIADAAGSP